MSSYLKWNDTLAAYFFNPSRAGQPVYLYTNEEIINDLGHPFGSRVPDFVSAVKQGPPWVTRDGLGQLHDLRHTCATLLLKRNVHPKLVQELLGHATIAVTLDTYSHFVPGMGDQAANAIESVLE